MSLVVSPSGQTNFGNTGVPIVALTATTATSGALTYTVSLSQSGTIFQVPAMNAASGLTITLPPVASAAGFNCKFTMIAIAASNVRVTSLAANVKSWISQGASPGAQTVSGSTGITYAQFATTAVAGDHIDVICDGTSYIIKSYSNVANGITAA